MPAKVHFLWQLKPLVIEHRVVVSYGNPITFKKPQQTMENSFKEDFMKNNMYQRGKNDNGK
jgi:hypothetical protein